MTLRAVLTARSTYARLFQILRDEGPVSAVRRAWAFMGRLRAAADPEAGIDPSTRYLMGFWTDMADKNAFVTSSQPAVLRRRRVVAMVGITEIAQCRKYRIEQPAELLARRGIDYMYAPASDLPRAIDALQGATHLMVYRLDGSDSTRALLYEARRLKLPVLYDIDDPLFSIQAYQTYGNLDVLPPDLRQRFLDGTLGYLEAMNACDTLSLSTPALRAHASDLSPRPAFLRRNFADRLTLEAGLAAMRTHRKRAGFTVAFASGSWGHEADFRIVEDQMSRFLEADPTRRLLILGSFRPSLLTPALQARVETRPFVDYDQYLNHLAEADCAVMPLRDDLFNRCKSAVRVIDACAVGVPSIVSPVGDLPSLVDDGRTGHVIGPAKTWHEALDRLAADRDATRAMGQAARVALERDWSAGPQAKAMDPALLDWIGG